MPKKRIKSLRCPTCRSIVVASDADFPFCSDRCRMIDLGKWASGVYKISSPALDPELLPEESPLRDSALDSHDSDPNGERRN